MVKLKQVTLGLLIVQLLGCAGISEFLHEPKQQERRDEAIVLQQLQDFSGSYAQKPLVERSIICATLFKKVPAEDELLHQLKLSFAVAVTPGCGSSSEAITLLESSRKMVTDEALTQAIDYQLLLLRRLRGVSRYALGLKTKASESRERAMALELKIEAIKSIEKALNKRD